MPKMTLKNLPRLRLVDLLRRRRMTLKQLLDDFGITTYSGLVNHCARIGVAQPTEAEFKVAHPQPPVNSPQEGVVVLDPPQVIDELSGRPIDPDAPVNPDVRVVIDAPEGAQKKLRKKKESAQGE